MRSIVIDRLPRSLAASGPKNKKIFRRLIDKALEISTKKMIGKKLIHGIFLLEGLFLFTDPRKQSCTLASR